MKMMPLEFLVATCIVLISVDFTLSQNINSGLLYPYSANLNTNNYPYTGNSGVYPGSNGLYPNANINSNLLNSQVYPNNNYYPNYPNTNLNNYPQTGNILAQYSGNSIPFNPNNPIVPTNNNYGIRYPFSNSFPVGSSYLGVNSLNNVNYPTNSILSSESSLLSCEYRVFQGCVASQGSGCRSCIDVGSNTCQCRDNTAFGRK